MGVWGLASSKKPHVKEDGEAGGGPAQHLCTRLSGMEGLDTKDAHWILVGLVFGAAGGFGMCPNVRILAIAFMMVRNTSEIPW